MLYRMVSIDVYSMTHHSTGQVGHFLRKDDRSEKTLAIYIVLFLSYLWLVHSDKTCRRLFNVRQNSACCVCVGGGGMLYSKGTICGPYRPLQGIGKVAHSKRISLPSSMCWFFSSLSTKYSDKKAVVFKLATEGLGAVVSTRVYIVSGRNFQMRSWTQYSELSVQPESNPEVIFIEWSPARWSHSHESRTYFDIPTVSLKQRSRTLPCQN